MKYPNKWLALVGLLVLQCGLCALPARANVLVVNVNGNGTVQGIPMGGACTQAGGPDCQFDSGQNDFPVTLTATPTPGLQFQGWGGECAGAGAAPTCSLVVIGFQDTTPPPLQNVSASFAAVPESLSVALAGSGQGKVQSDPQHPGIDCPGACTGLYPQGSQVTLTATSTAPTSLFTGWQGGGCTGTGVCTVVVNQAQTVQATFEADADADGVSDRNDQCPGTVAGATVDANGCSASQLDADGDGVPNETDQCPATPAGESADAQGCSNSQLDGDGDGVPNGADQCPATPAGESADAQGCSNSQLDADGDGVADGSDQCPDTPAGVAVDAAGCSEIQLFGNQLGELPGLGTSQRRLGARVDEICPKLIEQEAAGELTSAQQDLREACSRLKNRNTTPEQATAALNEISLSQMAALHDYMVELTHSQFRHLEARLQQVKSGGGRGMSVAGLNIRQGGEQLTGETLQSAFEGLLGMGASEEAFSDFGKLGVFLQGDIDDGDRSGSVNESGYDFDSWNVTVGADYRFSESLFAGGSLSYGEVQVDYENQRGSTDVDQWALSFYSGWQPTEHWFLDGMFSYGESDFKLARAISYVDEGGDFESRHRGDTDGDQLFFGLNTGYMFNFGDWSIGPVASLTYLDGTIDGYTESTHSGSEAWNFEVDNRDIKSLRLNAGLQMNYVFNTSFGVLVPGLRAAYVLESENDEERINVHLANNPFAESTLQSDRIVINVEPRDDAFFDVSVSLSAQFPMGIAGFTSYQFYSAYDDFSRNAYTIGLRWDKPF